jgi:hypothetical protein
MTLPDLPYSEPVRLHQVAGGVKRTLEPDAAARARIARAFACAQRKAAYLRKHPETAHGSNQHTRSGEVCHSSFADDQAAKTGASPRTVRQNAERGDKITGSALAMVKGTPLDKGEFLDRVKRASPERRDALVERGERD